MYGIRAHKRTADRLSDVLPWALLIAPEVLMNKDGSFQTTIRYRGPDLDSSTIEELVVKSSHLNDILRRLGSGWVIQAEAQRNVSTNYPDSQFPEPITALIDSQRAKSFESSSHFESNYYLSFTFLPPTEKQNWFLSLFIDSKAKINHKLVLENFRSEVSRAADLIARIFPEVEILADEALLTYLHSTISPKRHFVRLPEVPMYLDSVLADSPLVGGFRPKLGDFHLGIIGIQSFPGASQPGLLDQLNRLPIEYRWVTRFIFLDKGESKKELETFQRKWFGKRKKLPTIIKELVTNEVSQVGDAEALQKADDAKEALRILGTEDVGFGYLNTTFTLMARTEEELRALTTATDRIINGAGFTTRNENVNAVEAWLGSIPGNVQRDVRRPILNTLNLSHLLPGTSAVWGGQSENAHLSGPPLLLAKTGGSTPFKLSLHVGDVGHTLILGPTGSGKSTLLGVLEAQFLRYPDAQVYIFDKGASSLALTTAVGGDFYDLGAEDASLYFQPLGRVDDPAEKKWAHDWLIAIAEKENVQSTPEMKRAIWDALTSLASTPPEQRTIHALTVYMQNIELRRAFEPFTQNGPYGKLFDNTKDSLTFGKWQAFEMERLMEGPSKSTPTIVGPALAYLFHRLNQRFTGAPTLLVLDEAWLFLDHPAFSTKIRDWLKTLRKLNVAVIFATQSLDDVVASSIAPTVREACFTKIYLPNSIALQPETSDIYKRFGLNQRQIEILAYSMPKRDYYYTSPLGNRCFDLDLDELTLAYCAGASKEQQALVKGILAETSDTLEFNLRYLNKKGLGWAVKELEQLRYLKEAA